MNQITFPAAELKHALAGLSKVVSRKSALPVLQNVKVSRQRNGVVTLQATDLDAFATYTVTGNQPGEAVEMLLPFEQLQNALRCSGPKDEVALVCEDKQKAKLRYTIAGSPVNQPVNLMSVAEWPPLPKITTESAEMDKAFGPALRQALASCGAGSRAVLAGACLDVDDKNNHYIVGTNGHSLFAANSFTFPLKQTIIIPNSKFLSAGDLLDEEPCCLSVQPGKGRNASNHIGLQTAHWQFVTRAIEGNFPNWKRCVPTPDNKWLRVKLSPAAVSQLLQVVPKLPGQNGSNNPVRLRLDQGLFAEGRNDQDKEWTGVSIVEVQITGRATTVTLNRDYLLQALKFGLDEFALMEGKPVVFCKEGKRFVVMPIQPRESAVNYKPAASPQPPTPPQPQAEAKPERKTEMPKPSEKPEVKPVASPSLLDQIEQVKESAKNLVRDLTGLADVVKQAEKDKRANEKELENARTVLKKLQQVTI